jgi:hypothetical protein
MHYTREIPREGWADYLSLLSSVERDRQVRIETGSPGAGEQVMAEHLPLVDISLEEKGSQAGTIEVTVGRPGEEMTHRIPRPARLCAEESESGELERLDIEGSDRRRTFICFEQQLGLEEDLPQQA